jgi:hypothetical protein
VKKDYDKGNYDVGIFRVIDEVKHNLRKPIPIMSLGVLLIEE